MIALAPGWEIGIPNPTDISTADVFRLWDVTNACSLVNSTSYSAVSPFSFFFSSISYYKDILIYVILFVLMMFCRPGWQHLVQ